MGGCLIMECIVLLNWCEENGYGPLGLSGVSMGGHMASLAATNWPKPVVLVPCLSWSSASAVFTEGVMSESIDWNLLQEQYLNDSLVYERLSSLVTIIDKNCFSQLNDNIITLKEFNTVPLIGKNFAYRFLNSRQFYYMEKIRQSKIMSSKFVAALRLPKYIRRKQHPLLRKPRDAVMFMRGIMDECTHLKNYSVPVDTSLITVVCAKADGYVPRENCSSLAEIWPGVEIRYLRAGHVSAYVFYRKFFRNCIIETFAKAKDKGKIKIAQ